jgi:NAD(P)-dependent dehydrogenase (short-subunit alcohol dehydrogenase family)
MRVIGSGTTVVVGASGGIGLALASAILRRSRGSVVATARMPSLSAPLAALAAEHPGRVTLAACDLTDPASIAALAEGCGPIDLLLNAAGVLHDDALGVRPERRLAAVDSAQLAHVMAVNAAGPVLVAQALQPKLVEGAVIGNISARVGSIGDNGLGGWWSYRMSKAALNMATKNMAIELRRQKVVAVALHPGTTATALSEPFQRNVRPEKLFSPSFTANALLDVLQNLGLDDSGGFFAYDGSRIEF